MILLNKDLTTLKSFIVLWTLCQVSRACNDRPPCKCAMYSFRHESLTWIKSRERCQKDSGDLVSIETDKEWKYLTDFIQNLAGSKHAEYFIGLKLSNSTGSWGWLSNGSIEVPGQEWRWHDGEPSGDGHCVVMYKNYGAGNNPKTKGSFNDLSCNSRGGNGTNRGFICEKTVDCRCKNKGILDGKFITASPSVYVDGDASSPSPESQHKFKFILAIVVGSLDVVLFIVTVVLCRGIIRRSRRRNQPARRRDILK